MTIVAKEGDMNKLINKLFNKVHFAPIESIVDISDCATTELGEAGRVATVDEAELGEDLDDAEEEVMEEEEESCVESLLLGCLAAAIVNGCCFLSADCVHLY